MLVTADKLWNLLGLKPSVEAWSICRPTEPPHGQHDSLKKHALRVCLMVVASIHLLFRGGGRVLKHWEEKQWKIILSTSAFTYSGTVRWRMLTERSHSLLHILPDQQSRLLFTLDIEEDHSMSLSLIVPVISTMKCKLCNHLSHFYVSTRPRAWSGSHWFNWH